MTSRAIWALFLGASALASPAAADPLDLSCKSDCAPAASALVRISAKASPSEVLRRIGNYARTYYEHKPDELRFPWSFGSSELRSCCPDRACGEQTTWSEPSGLIIDAGQHYRYSFDSGGSGDNAWFRVRAVADPSCAGALEVWQVDGSVVRGKVTVTSPRRVDLAPCSAPAKRWEKIVLEVLTKERREEEEQQRKDEEAERQVDVLLGQESKRDAPPKAPSAKVDPYDAQRAREEANEELGKCIDERWGPRRRACMARSADLPHARACAIADLVPECRGFAKQAESALGPHPTESDVSALAVECVESFTLESRACVLSSLTRENLDACRRVASFYSYDLKTGTPSVSGGRDPHDVARRLAWRLPLIEDCRLDERMLLPDLAGTWTLTLEVAPSGAITKVDVTGLDGVEPLGKCIADAVRPLHMGRASQKAIVTWSVQATARR